MNIAINVLLFCLLSNCLPIMIHFTIMGTLQYEEYEKPVTKIKTAKIKKAYIDVAGLEIA